MSTEVKEDKNSKYSHESGVKQFAAQDESKPIVINWDDKFIEPGQYNARISLTINSDGSYNFAGDLPAVNSGQGWPLEFSLALGVKSSEGSVILFPYSGSLKYGRVWNKQGSNRTIKDNWKAFAKGGSWSGKIGTQWIVDNSPPAGSGGSDIGSIVGDVLGVLGGVLAAIF